MLRNDGKTCGVICYTCQNVLTNEECDTPVVGFDAAMIYLMYIF